MKSLFAAVTFLLAIAGIVSAQETVSPTNRTILPSVETTNGIIVKLVADKKVWAENEIPCFQATVINRDTRPHCFFTGQQIGNQIEFDGIWYDWRSESGFVDILSGTLYPDQPEIFDVTLDSHWHVIKSRQPLQISLGKHVVQIGVTEGHTNIVSNPVEILIQKESKVVSPTNRVELFNGKNFDDFVFCMRDDADPMKTWSVTNGLIHCNGSGIGYFRTKESFSNYVVTVVWRFVKMAPKKDNTGVLVHIQPPDKVWPMCVQNQGKSGHQGDLFVMSGAECKEHLGKDANTPVPLRGSPNENPIGEWNTNQTMCVSNLVFATVNGRTLNWITECTVSSGFIGIQSEGADFEIKSISLNAVEAGSSYPLLAH